MDAENTEVEKRKRQGRRTVREGRRLDTYTGAGTSKRINGSGGCLTEDPGDRRSNKIMYRDSNENLQVEGLSDTQDFPPGCRIS